MASDVQSRLIEPIHRPFNVEIELPGSKSIALRQLAISALSPNVTTIRGIPPCDDVDAMCSCLRVLGVDITQESNSYTIDPKNFDSASNVELDARMSGVTLRLMLSIAALRQGSTRFDGHESLRARPNQDLLDALSQLSCDVESNDGRLPITVRGPALGNAVSLRANVSSQYLSALLLVACRMNEGLTIHLLGKRISSSYVEITLNEMQKRGVEVVASSNSFHVNPSTYTGSIVIVEGDASGATYFSALATLHSSRAVFRNLGVDSVQGDLAFFDVCERLGSVVTKNIENIEIQGPAKMNEIGYIDMEEMPDAALTMMAIAPYLHSQTHIDGLATLPFKECDRIACPARELRKTGVQVVEGEHDVTIIPTVPSAATFDTYDDHRMAMALAVFGTKTPGCRINNPSCVSKTYRVFWKDLDLLYDR